MNDLKLVLIMLCDNDKDRVLKVLVEYGYTPTFIASTGNFLEFGKSVLLLGVQKEKIEEIKMLVDTNTRRSQIKDHETLKADLYVLDANMIKTRRI